MNKKRMKIQEMALISLMAAMLCIIGPATIPVGVVPVSLIQVALFLMVYMLGMWKTFGSCLIYICIGLIGLPIFSGYSAGPAVLLGPTGGYIWGYLLLIVCSGFFIERFAKMRWHLLGMLLGLLICYLIGTIWLKFSAQLTIRQAVLTGIVPFVIFDLIKITVALLLGPAFRRHLKKAGVI